MRWWCLNDLFFMCQVLFPDVVEEPHGDICRFMEEEGPPISLHDYENNRAGLTIAPDYKLEVGSRKILKTSIKQAWLVQTGLKNPNLRFLLLSNTITNARIDLSMVRALLMNPVLRMLFCDIIPTDEEIAKKKTKWSEEEVCLKRTEDYPEPTYTAAGLKKTLTMRHYNIIVPDDIVVAKLDTMSAEEIRPSAGDVEKAIGYDQTQFMGLLEEKPTHRGDPKILYPSRIMSLNNRWGDCDYVDYLLRYRPEYKVLIVPIVHPKDHPAPSKRCQPVWPAGPMGTLADLERIFATMSSYIASTQYLCNPTDPAEQVFRKEWIKYYLGRPPIVGRPVAMMDLGLSQDKSACYTATVVVGQDEKGCWYVLDAVRDHLDTKGQKDMFFSLCEVWKPRVFCMEDVLFQDKMLDAVREDPRYHMLLDWEVSFYGEQPLKGESKDQRIEYLQPRVRNQMIVFKREHTELISELTRYRRGYSGIKDLIDALAYIARLMPPPECAAKAQVFKDEAGIEDGILYDDIENILLYGDDSEQDIFGCVA